MDKVIVEGLEERNPHKFGGMVSRAISLAKKEFNFKDGIETVATTEQPALVVDWERWEVVREILPMRYMQPVNNDKVPLLDSHMKKGVDMIKGSASNFSIEGDCLMCRTFISDSEEMVKQKIKEGHIDSVSIGYQTEEEFTIEIPKGKSIKIDGYEYKNEFTDFPMVVRTKWKVHELSLVPIGADDAAKFKSLAGIEDKEILKKIDELSKRIDDEIGKGKTSLEVADEIHKEQTEQFEILKLKHEQNKRKLWKP